MVAQLGVADPDGLPVLPPLSVADQQRSRLTGERALKEHWDPRGRGVERAARPGWFFTGRRQALSQLVAWLTAAPTPADNVRVVTGGPGSGKSAVLARLVTMSDPQYRAGMPGPLAPDDPVAEPAPRRHRRRGPRPHRPDRRGRERTCRRGRGTAGRS